MAMVTPVTPMFFCAPPCKYCQSGALKHKTPNITYEDHGIFADINLPADEVRAHIGHNKALILLILTLCLQRLGEALELNTIHGLVVAEVDKGRALATLTLGRGQ